MRLPFTEPPRSRVRSLLRPEVAAGVAVAGVVAAVAVTKLIASRMNESSGRPTHVPPTGTARETSDKPAGTELHPPNANFARQGPGAAAGANPKVTAKSAQTPATGKPPAGAGPGAQGIPTPKR